MQSFWKRICEAPLFAGGFRPFFLGASIFVALAVAFWLPAYFGEFEIPTAFAPRDWHVHEMLFGFAPAVIAGFLLTAIPNWTGRMPLKGQPLILLLGAWVLGRIAVFFSSQLHWSMALVADGLFLAVLLAVILREIVAGENWRNLRVASLVGLLLVGNIAFHLEARLAGLASYSERAGLSVVLLLIILIGGRIIPSFTRNWLTRQKGGRLPAAFDSVDAASIAAAALALASWTLAPDHWASALLLALAGLAHGVRLARWAGDRTWPDRLLFVLHASYAFLPVGFVLLAAGSLAWAPRSAGIHALAVGVIGLMTLAVMSRVSLGHSGRALVASRSVQAAYACVALAAILRVMAALMPTAALGFLHATAFFWIIGFAVFTWASWGILTKPRPGRA